MKPIKYIFILLLLAPLLISCDEDDAEVELIAQHTTQLVALENFTGGTGCESSEQLTFIVSYGDIQVDFTIEAGNTAFSNVFVEDGESINVIVQRTLDNSIAANASVSVRTDSRPEALDGTTRRVIFCDTFDLIFQNF